MRHKKDIAAKIQLGYQSVEKQRGGHFQTGNQRGVVVDCQEHERAERVQLGEV